MSRGIDTREDGQSCRLHRQRLLLAHLFALRSRGGFRNVGNYVAKVLRPDDELWGWNSPKPPGMVMAPNMSMFDAFNYDRWFDDFFQGFISSDMPAVVLGMYGANFFAPGDSSPYDTTKALPGWTQVRRGFKEGVAHALFNYLGTDIRRISGRIQGVGRALLSWPELRVHRVRDPRPLSEAMSGRPAELDSSTASSAEQQGPVQEVSGWHRELVDHRREWWILSVTIHEFPR